MKDIGFGIVVVFCLLTLTLIAIFSGLVDPSNRLLFAQSKLIYGCVRIPNNIHCDSVPNRFSSILVPGDAQEIYAVTPSSFGTVPGIFGNALPLKGYIGQFLTIQNNPTINPKTFSVSLWAKLDPSFDLDSTIIAHSNRENTAGWFIRIKIGQPQPELQFSVTNNQGQIFTAKAPIDKDKFRFIVGTFDGTFLKLYLDGVLIDKAEFSGLYQPNPEGPLNLGVDTFDHTNAWKGVIDDVRLFNRVISESEIGDILSGKFVAHEGLTGYWSFDNNTKDNSGNGNNGLLSTQAVSMIFAPDGRLFFTEKNLGDVRIIKDDKILPQPFVTIKDVYVAQHQGLLGITLDPKFESNHYVYVYYTSKGNKTGDNFNRVVRFTESNNKATEEKVLLDKIPASPEGEFAGGALAFGPDDKLYISSGHANSVVLPQNVSSLIGKVLRINRDGTIPSDNPFPNSAVYTIGHRNIFGIAFDKKSGIGVVTENGDAHYDEINVLKKGANYGFPSTQPPTMSPLLDNSTSVKPVRVYWETIAPTQAIFYDGNKFGELKDKLIFGSYNQGFIYAIGLNKTHSVVDELAIQFLYDDNVDSVAQSPSGDIYFGGYNIYKLTSINMEEPEETTHFIEFILNNVGVEHLNFDNRNSSLTFDVKTNGGQTISSPSIQVRIPKVLFNGIFDVSAPHSLLAKKENPVQNFDIKQQYRSSAIGDTIVQINLKNDVKDTIVIKGLKSGLTG